ncbi:MAG: patatin-like phospholipase family protein [Polyangiales bacterium]
MWNRALVLGGGGLVGVAWESGLCAGLFEDDVDLRECQAFIGTSAGAINCARLASGHWPPTPDSPPVTGAEGTVVDPARLDLQALGTVFQLWSAIERTTPSAAREIGKLARPLYRDAEAAWIRGITATVGLAAWPDKPFFVTAVDVDSGERTVFDATQGVAVGQAIAASCSVPGIFASVAIGERLYMDGQVHSSTHADLLLTHPRAQKAREVVIAMPTNQHTAPGIGAHAERAVRAEIAALEAAGCSVRLITPSAEQALRLGTNLMDAAKTPDAFAVGFETGRALSRQLA